MGSRRRKSSLARNEFEGRGYYTFEDFQGVLPDKWDWRIQRLLEELFDLGMFFMSMMLSVDKRYEIVLYNCLLGDLSLCAIFYLYKLVI